MRWDAGKKVRDEPFNFYVYQRPSYDNISNIFVDGEQIKKDMELAVSTFK